LLAGKCRIIQNDYAKRTFYGFAVSKGDHCMPLNLSQMSQGISASVTLKQNALVAELRAQGLDVIGLGAGEPDFNTPEHIRDAAKKAIDTGKTRYTDTSGLPELRRAISEFLKRDKGLSYPPSDIIVGTGAKQAIMGALLAILNPGDEVILPAPCWVSYPEMIRMAGGVPVVVHTTAEQGFIPDIQAVAAAVTPRTKAVLLNTPGNPTGAVWPESALLSLGNLAVDKGFYILSDEIYEKLVYDGAKHVSVAALSPDIFRQTVMISGFSKAYAMTGWRLGYAAGPHDLIAAMGAYQSHATGNPTSISQYAGLAAITGDQACVADMAKAFAARRILMLDCIRQIPLLSAVEPQGAFYIMLDVRKLMGKTADGVVLQDSGDFADALLKKCQVAVVPGEPFYAPGFCRLSYAIANDKIVESMRRIRVFVEGVIAG
jgi:aspartate aminotransferase